MRKAREHRAQIIRRGRADVTEILRHDHIWLYRPQLVGVQAIKAFATAGEVVDLTVNFLFWQSGGKFAVNHHRLAAGLFGIIAFESDPANRVAETQSEQDLSS